MDETLDIFRGDYFSATTLDEVADDVPFLPQALGELNLFEDKPIRTTTVMVSWKRGSFELVPTTERGGPETTKGRRDRKLHYFETVALRQKDRIHSHELTDILANERPLEVRLRDAVTEVNDRAAIMRTDNEVTMEYHRLGALQGILLDANGEVLYNYFTEFGIPEPVAVEFDFAAINLAPNEFITFVESNVLKPILRSLGKRKSAGTRIGALVGDNFWAGLMSSEPLQRTYLNWQAAAQLRQGLTPPWGQFDFAGVTWINYRGTDDGTTIAIGTNEAIFFPIGARDVFRVYWAPGERMRDQGKKGEKVYLIVTPDPRENMDEWVDVRVRCYPLFICIFPKALMRGVRID
jgi:hypothetical protein